MKRTCATGVLILALAFGGPAWADTVRVGYTPEAYPPFFLQDASGKWGGWELEIVDALCVEAKLDCVLTPTAWDGIIPALTTKKIDMIAASMSITEERMKTIDFSDRYYKSPAEVVAARGSEISATPEGLKGKILGVQVSTTHEAYARKHFASAVAEIKGYQTQDEAFQDLAAGRVDAVQGEAIAAEGFLASDQGKACCEAKGNVVDDPEILGLGAGFGFRQDDDPLREKINAAIKGIRASGKYDEISKKYFTFDIYGD
ncbi:transporter substrate-binding domain-containing protein [Mesorhizobium tianshanense]|uniref:Polar amino acid transport system substrate-binding protein n=1 Tax=Mesorhizobium tianshanense TaxID=39844 RepID=A0A562MBC8_9HYPH|nr:transporter substrate-binding domain-containing protein [Mesorhizobium tianshanense]TWI17108.1 polar amino acid transport system substrate-binding protein [Mesorhizobium tianshanense]